MNSENNNPITDSSYAGLRVLITGGGGFIGSHLVARLISLGAQVISIGGNRISSYLVEKAHYVFGEIAGNTLETIDFVPQVIFHLAGGSSVARSVENPPDDFLKTVFSTVKLLDFAQRNWPEAKIVYVSSAAIYGQALHKEASHDLSCLPISPYGVHKKQVETLLLDYARMYGTRSIIVRAFSVYGPGLRKQLLWDALEKGTRGNREFFGSGDELRDWVYVADLVDCLLRCSGHASVDVPVLNAGTGRAVSVREILTQLFQIANLSRTPEFIGLPKIGDPDSLVAEGSAESLLGPLFITSLNDGLRAYVNWYQLVRGIHA